MNKEAIRRRLMADAFRRAKKFLIPEKGFPEPGQTRYICYAISLAVPENASTAEQDAHNAAENLISHRIIGSAFLDGWVMKNIPGIAEYELQDRAGYLRMMQAYRHRWLDALIEEFSK